MPIKKAANSGLGLMNRTFPFWELGANLYWHSESPAYVQELGGKGTVNYTYFGNVMHPYYYYDVGRGHFKLVTPGAFSALVNVTGTTILRASGPIGNGTLTYLVGAPKQLRWTAPGDAIGTAVNVGTGSYTLRSADTSLWIRVQCVNGSLPAGNTSDVVACSVPSAEFPKDGFAAPGRTNYFDDTMSATRGFATVDVGLTATNPAITASHIIDSTSSGLAVTFRAQNAFGSAQRMSRQEALSTTVSRNFSVLLHRSDNGVINGAVASLYISTTHGGANEGTANIYKKIRSDGWYEVCTTIAAAGGPPTKYLGIEIANGYTLDVEAPGFEGFGASISGGTNPPPYMSSSTINSSERGWQILYVNRKVSGGVASEPYPSSGFIGVTLVHPYASAPITLPAGTAVSWDVDDNNTLRVAISSTYQTVVASAYKAAASVFYLYNVAAVPINMGTINGLVVAWGKYENVPYAILCVNGKQIDVDTTFTMPTGTPAQIRIGHDYNYAAAGAGSFLPAKAQHVIIGRNPITRSECRMLSLWLQRQALSDLA
jgi:hypothetical protein